MTGKEKSNNNSISSVALRRSCRISKRERITNDLMVLKETVLEAIQRKQLIWFGHVKIISNNRFLKMSMKYISQKKKKRGRPRQIWYDRVKLACSENGIKEEWCMDRVRWKRERIFHKSESAFLSLIEVKSNYTSNKHDVLHLCTTQQGRCRHDARILKFDK
ncbi:uncharacterized protein LOC111639631 [Centruroides sculpturatus]|uniref:uncharacterized protein LOC111639631 n=1 Tax=Centruroides sculpturatus TaxID=218467 RepID=UPI000C6E6B93|nr:uncharacterized protein LOC111639631 [Centruroides sculpturatus]